MILNNGREESRIFAFERRKRKMKKEFAELNYNLQKEMIIMNLQSENDLALDEKNNNVNYLRSFKVLWVAFDIEVIIIASQ